MITMLVLQPVASTIIHMKYIIHSVRFQGQVVARFNIRKLLHLADAATAVAPEDSRISMLRALPTVRRCQLVRWIPDQIAARYAAALAP